MPPVILKTAVNVKQNVLVWSDRTDDKIGRIRPKRFSKNEIVANLPPDIEPATYGLSVTSASRSTSGFLSVAHLPEPLKEQGAQP